MPSSCVYESCSGALGGVETDRPVSAMAEPEPEPGDPAQQAMPNLRIAASPEG